MSVPCSTVPPLTTNTLACLVLTSRLIADRGDKPLPSSDQWVTPWNADDHDLINTVADCHALIWEDLGNPFLALNETVSRLNLPMGFVTMCASRRLLLTNAPTPTR